MSMKIFGEETYHPSNATRSRKFCHDFLHSNKQKYIFGINKYADSIASRIPIDGYIDEYTRNTQHMGKPIYTPDEINASALVVGSVIGKPWVIERKAKKYPFSYLDYFSFYRDSGITIEPIMFWSGFREDFSVNRERFEQVHKLLEDECSKNTMEAIINFRLTYDLSFMKDFEQKEDKQYFEDFLMLQKHGESFVDIGGFDGFTTEEFIKRCPGYDRIFFFEPEHKNMLLAIKRLKERNNISYLKVGLANQQGEVRFNTSGSSSKIDSSGNEVVKTDKLDNLIDHPVTFIKMDIEGAELEALKGARITIEKHHPRLAVSVYHRPDDFWRIPEFILSISPDYKLFMRHYTTGIAETVMFFIPK